jgi:hypothetical protein
LQESGFPATAEDLRTQAGRPDLATAAGPGCVVFVRERRGPDYILPVDRVWAEVLATMCRTRRIVVRGTYLTTPGGGTRRLY